MLSQRNTSRPVDEGIDAERVCHDFVKQRLSLDPWISLEMIVLNLGMIFVDGCVGGSLTRVSVLRLLFVGRSQALLRRGAGGRGWSG
jgi:hypothetical protein